MAIASMGYDLVRQAYEQQVFMQQEFVTQFLSFHPILHFYLKFYFFE